MAEDTEEKERKKKRGGLGEFLANKEAIYALGSGFTAASRGGDFSSGLSRGLADWGAIQDRNAAREMAHLEAQNAEQQRQRMAAFRDTLAPEQQALFDLDPKAWTGAEIKAAHATAGKGTSAKQKYDELLGMGISPDKAFNLAYGKKSMRFRTNPDGSVELYEGYDEEGQKPLSLGAEAKGRYAAGLPNVQAASDALTTMEREGYNPNKDTLAFGIKALENSPLIRYTFPGAAEYAAKVAGGENFQTFNQNVKAFEATVLPILSGAAVTPSEAERQVAAAIPQPGDGEAVRKAKGLYRRRLIEAARVLLNGGEYDLESIATEASRIEEMMLGGGATEVGDEPFPGFNSLSPEEQKRARELMGSQ